MKIAIYQGQGREKRVAENLEIIRSASLSAAKQGARLIIFPEMFLTGYNIGDAVFELAERPDGPATQKVRKENPVLADRRPELYAAPVKK